MSQLSVTTELARYGPRAGRAQRLSRGEALAYCRNLALRQYENFTVASWLLPRPLLPHFYAIYAYCRWADDLADEIDQPGESLRLLDWWEVQLQRCYAGQAEHPVFIALLPTIEEFSIPQEPLGRLLTAFRQDQHVTRYATAEDVLGYCQNSANPVGRLVLHIGRCHDEERGKLSDSICSGLQLTNFCQDVARDWAKDRIYLPRATLAQAGYTDEMFARGQYNEAFRRAMRVEVDRAEHHLRRGEPLVERMPADLRIDIALIVAGGLSVLSAIRKLDFNVWHKRPRLSRVKQLGLLTRCWWRTKWRSSERPAA